MFRNIAHAVMAFGIIVGLNYLWPELTVFELTMMYSAWFIIFSLWDINKKLHE